MTMPPRVDTDIDVRPTGARLIAGLAAAGSVLLAACLFFAFVQPQTPGRMARASADLIPELGMWAWMVGSFGGLAGDRLFVTVALLATSALGFAAYAAALWMTWRRRSSVASVSFVVAASVLFCAIAVMALPTQNTDIYNYIINGRIGAIHHSNPYYTPAADFPHDPIYRYASPRQIHVPGDAKLPAWTLISTGLAMLGGDSPVTNLLVYRSAFLIFTLANLLMVAAVLRRLDPGSELAGLVAYGWNPIVLVLGQSKTDTAMVSFLLLSILLLITDRRRSAIVALAVSALVKLFTAPLAVVYGIGELRRGHWREILAATVLGSLIVVAFFAMFWDGAAIITHHLRWGGSGGQSAGGLLRPMLKWGFLALIAVVGLVQDGTPQRLLRGWVVVMLYFCLFLGKFAFGWYLLTLIALSALVADWRLTSMTTVLSFSAFTLDAWYRTSSKEFRLDASLPVPRLVAYVALPLAVAAAIAVIGLWRSRTTARATVRARLFEYRRAAADVARRVTSARAHSR